MCRQFGRTDGHRMFCGKFTVFFQEKKRSKNGDEVKACELMVLQSPKAITME